MEKRPAPRNLGLLDHRETDGPIKGEIRMFISLEELLDPTRIACLPFSPEEAYGIHDDDMAPRLSGRGSSRFNSDFIPIGDVSEEHASADCYGLDDTWGEDSLIEAIDRKRLIGKIRRRITESHKTT